MFGRIRCHYCGSRQPYSRSVRQFECSNCQALNFFDGKGNVSEVPNALAANPISKSSFSTSTKPVSMSLDHQREKAFCRVCIQNQQFYNEALANYLPDESDPRYRQFERDLPRFKKDLEQRYPLICTSCAAKAQHKINRADYYALTTNASLRCSETRARKGQLIRGSRDSWDKKILRSLLNIFGIALNIGLFAQVAFHLYGILLILMRTDIAKSHDIGYESALDTFAAGSPGTATCLRQAMSLNPTAACYTSAASIVPWTLILTLSAVWYNPGHKQWFHPDHRIESVTGQRNYLMVTFINICIRTWAWRAVSNIDTLRPDTSDHFLAIHGFVAVVVPLIQFIAARNVVAQKWTIKGHCMPKPEERDVLGVGAGPSPDHHTPKHSGADPFRYLRQGNEGFDASPLKQRKQNSSPFAGWSRQRTAAQEPTPEYSDDDDAMDIDIQQPRLQPSHTYFRNPNAQLTINDLSQELSSVEATMQADQARQNIEAASKLRYNPRSPPPSQQNSFHQPSFALPPKTTFNQPAPQADYITKPFQGTLPPAPMSMNRRLRNPVVPVNQQSHNSHYNPPSSPPQSASAFQPSSPLQPERSEEDQDSTFFTRMAAGLSPVQFPEKGTNAQVAPGKWVLPQDVRTLGGLEERFGSVFSLDEIGGGGGDGQEGGKGWFKGWFG